MQANTYEADSLWKLEECHVFYCHECHGITVRQLRSLYLSQKPEHTHLAPSHLLSSHCNGNQNSNLKSNSGINSNKVSTDAQNVSSVLYVSSLTHENHTDNAITPQLHQNKNSPPYNYLYSARRIQNSNITNLPKTNQTDYKWGKNHINNERQGTESHTPRFMRQTVSSRMKIKSKYSTRNSSMWRPRNTNVDSDKNFFNMASITNPAKIVSDAALYVSYGVIIVDEENQPKNLQKSDESSAMIERNALL
ncbi:unnamed protein product [Thelazia callipaeda]|uniref:Arf-GAP domain-containing protein n=1 Tax=Thelazia callipaeda TaxID=103827 RepID=A0A0N5D3J9_THECL|nr:unnamed protein product [Thelazia callipaeda]